MEHAIKDFFAFRVKRVGLLSFCCIDLGIKIHNNQLTVLSVLQINELFQVVNRFVSFAFICGAGVLANDAQRFCPSGARKRNIEVSAVTSVVEKARLYVGKVNVFKVGYWATAAHDA